MRFTESGKWLCEWSRRALSAPAAISNPILANVLYTLLICFNVRFNYWIGVTMPPKIFVGDVRCLAIAPNKCARFIWAL